MSCAEFVGPYEASLSDSGPPYETSAMALPMIGTFDILNHPIEWFTLDRWRGFNVMAPPVN